MFFYCILKLLIKQLIFMSTKQQLIAQALQAGKIEDAKILLWLFQNNADF